MSSKHLSKLSLPGEEWKDLADFRGYAVSTYGRVYSYFRHCLLPMVQSNFRMVKGKKVYSAAGYYAVALQQNKKQTHRFVHQLVARAFLDNDDPEVNTVVDHIDNDPFNNMASNLRWVAPRENIQAARNDETQKYTRWLRKHLAGHRKAKR